MTNIYRIAIECIEDMCIGDLLYDQNISKEDLISAIGEIAGILDLIASLEEKGNSK